MIALLTTGCRSASISATLVNHTASPVTLVELDYPSASFGVQQLAPGEQYQYRFKIRGNGGSALIWRDAARQEHKSSGPTMHEGDEGTLLVSFETDGPVWNLQVTPRGAR